MRTVNNGEIDTIAAGQKDTGDIVLFGGTLEVLAGGLAIGTTIDTGGLEVVFLHGTDINATGVFVWQSMG